MSDKISYTKDKSGDGFLLRGPAGLQPGSTVTVTKKDGSTKSERVGDLRAGPFDDGNALYTIGGKASAPRQQSPSTICQNCGHDTRFNSNGAPSDDGGEMPF